MPEEPVLESEFLKPLDDGLGPARLRSATELERDVRQVVGLVLPSVWRRQPRVRLAWLVAALGVPGICAALVVAKPWEQSASDGPAVSTQAAPSPMARLEQVPGSKLSEGDSKSAAVVPALTPSAVGSESRGSVLKNAPGAATSSSEVARSVPRASGSSAADALKAANELRGEGRWGDAARAYSQIAHRFAGSAQGSVAALAAAALYLEHLGDPNKALGYYQRSLKMAGLSAEAQYGVAKCYRALGNRSAEARALERLVNQFPGGLYASRAQQRLRVLESEAR